MPLQQQKTAYILREIENYVWMRRYFFDSMGEFEVIAFSHTSRRGIKSLAPDLTIDQVIDLVKKGNFSRVIFLSNQDGVLADSQIAQRLNKQGIKAVAQSVAVARLGVNKISQKEWFVENNFSTPPFAIASSLTEAHRAGTKLGYPVVLKVASLSDGRKMKLAFSADEVQEYYYENAIDEKVIVEKFISGQELSTIVYYNFGRPVVFPVIYKPSTEYLLQGKSVRKRVYISPHPDLDDVHKGIQDLALKISEKMHNEYILGMDFVMDKNRKLFLLECNVRLVETLRMSLLLTRKDLLRSFHSGLSIEAHSAFLPPHGFVVDLPVTPSQKEKLAKHMKKNPDSINLGDHRVTIWGTELDQLLKKSTRLMGNN